MDKNKIKNIVREVLGEIKINNPSPSPEEVANLLINKWNINKNYIKISSLLSKFGYYNFNNGEDKRIEFILQLSEDKLHKFYQELQKIIN